MTTATITTEASRTVEPLPPADPALAAATPAPLYAEVIADLGIDPWKLDPTPSYEALLARAEAERAAKVTPLPVARRTPNAATAKVRARGSAR